MTDIDTLDAATAMRALDELAQVLWDCVDGGASVNFVKPYGMDEARAFWRKVIPGLAAGGALLLAARQEGKIAGTVMLGLDTPPNQPHRADVKKLLVHRGARRQGLARALMLAAEAEARRLGRFLLTLDTQHGGAAERLYRALGYVELGILPDYSLSTEGQLEACAFFYKDLRGAQPPT